MNAKIEIGKHIAAQWIRSDEGFLLEPAPDIRGGEMRIGFGSACPPYMTFANWSQAEQLLKRDLLVAASDANGYLGHLSGAVNATRYAVLVCMAYQMGGPGLMGFAKLRRAISDGDWEAAAVEMLDSAWSGQTPERAGRLAAHMRDGR